MEDIAPQAEAVTEASRPSEPESAEPRALASFADALASDVGGSEDREASESSPEPKPAPTSGDVRSGGRRSQAAAANAARIAELERQVAERDPEKIRADLETQRQRAAEDEAVRAASDAAAQKAAWYARVRDVPDRNLSDEEYREREAYKAELDAYTTTFPKAQQAFSAQAQQAIEGGWANIQAHIKAEMGRSFSKPGVDRDAASKETTYERIADHLYEGGRASRQPEVDALAEKVRRLEAEGRQFRLSGANGLGAARAPINGGRSAAHANGRPDFRTASSSALFEAAIRSTNGDE